MRAWLSRSRQEDLPTYEPQTFGIRDEECLCLLQVTKPPGVLPTIAVAFVCMVLFGTPAFAQAQQDVRNHEIKISFGHTSQAQISKFVTLKSTVPDLVIGSILGRNTEPNDKIGTESVLNCGAGDVDELIASVTWKKPSAELRKVFDKAKMWRYFLDYGAPGQVERMRQDSWNQPDAPLLTVQLNNEGTEGFSFSLEQLLERGAMWLPEHDIFL